jgi:hypothetical protein
MPDDATPPVHDPHPRSGVALAPPRPLGGQYANPPPMNHAADEYRRKHLDDANAVKWPADTPSKIDVAQTLLGIHFVANSDYWFGYAEDLVTNAQPGTPYARPSSEFATKDRAYREAFATLDGDQRRAVLRLIRNVADGATYSSLVKLDQFPHANLVVQFANREGEPPYVLRVVPGEHGIGIHERWHEWVNAFSSRDDRDAAAG